LSLLATIFWACGVKFQCTESEISVSQIRKFIEWMSFHPTTEEIARALATDYLTEYSVQGVRFGRINSDDSIVVLGQYGYPDADQWRGRSIPSAEWRAIDADDVRMIANATKEQWNPTATIFVNTLRDHGVIQGYLIVEFTKPIDHGDKQKTAEAIDDLCIPIALYLSFQNRGPANSPGVSQLHDSRDTGSGQLSARQLSILRGMVEGKTNHELATELGFSVSTIRHETMRIYQALSVSDRKEAAKKALMLGMI
jgi:DNA-binding CsgD family transcriptional regulator